MRLDSTTNWAVVTTAAVLTFAFSAQDRPHIVIVVSLLLIWLFLVIEARRYRYYELSSLRVRLMETEFFCRALDLARGSDSNWATQLIGSLLTPEFPISFWEAIGRRLRRNYIWIFLILGGAWVIKLMLYPVEASSWRVLVEHAAIGLISGETVLLAVGAFYVAVFLLAILTLGLRASPGEVLSHHELLEYPGDFFSKLTKAAKGVVNRHEQLAIIITDRAEEVSQRLLTVLKRGVTSLEGRGMYTGESRHVLFCAVRPSEISQVKSVVYAADEKAFVVINPTERVWGGGFRDLAPNWAKPAGKQ